MKSWNMQFITATFLRGLIALLPLSLSLYVLYVFFVWADRLARQILLIFIPEQVYVPGMGMLLGIGLIFFLGLLTTKIFFQKFQQWQDSLFSRVPIVKSIYSSVRDLTGFFSPRENIEQKVVMVSIPGQPVEWVGFLTRGDLTKLPQGLTRSADRVAVYLPFSYQLGGWTVFIPRSWIREVNMSMEEAMKSVLTAWMVGNDKKNDRQET